MEVPFIAQQNKDTGSVHGQSEWDLGKAVYRERWKPGRIKTEREK